MAILDNEVHTGDRQSAWQDNNLIPCFVYNTNILSRRRIQIVSGIHNCRFVLARILFTAPLRTGIRVRLKRPCWMREARHTNFQVSAGIEPLAIPALWQEAAQPLIKHRSVAECLTDQQGKLMRVPAAFDSFIEVRDSVSSNCLITFEHNPYSVPGSFANREISLRVYPQRLVIVAEAQVVAEHVRVFN